MEKQGPEAAVAGVLARRPAGLRILRAVAALNLPDSWVGAGFVRNAVWDDLHGYEGSRATDVDVIYFDPAETSAAADRAHETRLRAVAPDVPWSVKNQARMHLRNGDQPYRDTAHALTHWPETCTAVAARLVPGGIEILAPFGVDDLFDLVVRPTPHFASKLEAYHARLDAKRWRERWPGLRLQGASPDDPS